MVNQKLKMANQQHVLATHHQAGSLHNNKISEYKPLKLYHLERKGNLEQGESIKDEIHGGRDTVNYNSENETQSPREHQIS